jgi:hypothetical protein
VDCFSGGSEPTEWTASPAPAAKAAIAIAARYSILMAMVPPSAPRTNRTLSEIPLGHPAVPRGFFPLWGECPKCPKSDVTAPLLISTLPPRASSQYKAGGNGSTSARGEWTRGTLRPSDGLEGRSFQPEPRLGEYVGDVTAFVLHFEQPSGRFFVGAAGYLLINLR